MDDIRKNSEILKVRPYKYFKTALKQSSVSRQQESIKIFSKYYQRKNIRQIAGLIIDHGLCCMKSFLSPQTHPDRKIRVFFCELLRYRIALRHSKGVKYIKDIAFY